MNEPVLEARAVHKSFRQGPELLQVLTGVQLTVAPGETAELRLRPAPAKAATGTAAAPLGA